MQSFRSSAMCGALVALTALMAPTGSQAAHFDLNYTLPASAGQGVAYDYNGTHMEFVYFWLDDQGPLMLSLQQGDTITHTVHFTGELTLPNQASSDQTFYWLGLRNSTGDFPSDVVGAVGSLSLLYQGVTLMTIGPFSSGGGYEVAFGAYFAGGAPRFDEVIADFTVTQLSRPVTVDSSYLMFRTTVPVVPEPATWALWLAGLGAASAIAQRRRPERLAMEA